MIYLDTSALLKQLVEVRESAALESYLLVTPGLAFASALAEVELPVAVARRGLAIDSTLECCATSRSWT